MWGAQSSTEECSLQAAHLHGYHGDRLERLEQHVGLRGTELDDHPHVQRAATNSAVGVELQKRHEVQPPHRAAVIEDVCDALERRHGAFAKLKRAMFARFLLSCGRGRFLLEMTEG